VKVLLDTSTFLWSCLDVTKLSPKVRDLLADGSHDVFVSAVSAWEVAIKYAKGRLDIPEPPGTYIPSRLAAFGYQPLAVQLTHAIRAGDLPALHRDPFDRLLVAQAEVERLPIVTPDTSIARYDVEVIW
jgi:PIN domain nuclease of toxin-antitoxin system